MGSGARDPTVWHVWITLTNTFWHDEANSGINEAIAFVSGASELLHVQVPYTMYSCPRYIHRHFAKRTKRGYFAAVRAHVQAEKADSN